MADLPHESQRPNCSAPSSPNERGLGIGRSRLRVLAAKLLAADKLYATGAIRLCTNTLGNRGARTDLRPPRSRAGGGECLPDRTHPGPPGSARPRTGAGKIGQPGDKANVMNGTRRAGEPRCWCRGTASNPIAPCTRGFWKYSCQQTRRRCHASDAAANSRMFATTESPEAPGGLKHAPAIGNHASVPRPRGVVFADNKRSEHGGRKRRISRTKLGV